MKKWKIAVVGCGDITEHVYLPELKDIKKAEVTACCDPRSERTNLFREKFGIPHEYATVDDLITKEDFDILMDIASIPAHYEINMKALNAGKHLYSQKPIGLSVREATDMIEAAEKSGVKFAASPIHMLRNDMREAKRLIQNDIIGKITLVRSLAAHGGPEYFQYRENDPLWFYEYGAGALFDLGVHALHWVTGLLGSAKTVSCKATVSSPARVIRSGKFAGKHIKTDKLFDNYLIHLGFENGAMADIVTGYCVKATTASMLEIYGEKGSIIFTDNPVSPLKIYIDDIDRQVRGWLDQLPQERPGPAFRQSMCIEDLIGAIEEDRQPAITAEHARHVIEIICAAEECAKDGRVRRLKTQIRQEMEA
jgi:predicted dehydrogenase